MISSTEKRWPRTLAFKQEAEREIYSLQARLISDPDESKEIRERIEELKRQIDQGSRQT